MVKSSTNDLLLYLGSMLISFVRKIKKEKEGRRLSTLKTKKEGMFCILMTSSRLMRLSLVEWEKNAGPDERCWAYLSNCKQVIWDIYCKSRSNNDNFSYSVPIGSFFVTGRAVKMNSLSLVINSFFCEGVGFKDSFLKINTCRLVIFSQTTRNSKSNFFGILFQHETGVTCFTGTGFARAIELHGPRMTHWWVCLH